MGVVLKRAVFFITCQGRMMTKIKMEEQYITNNLIYNEPVKPVDDGVNYRQMNLFSDYGVV